MNEYNTVNAKLSDSQLNKLKRSVKKKNKERTNRNFAKMNECQNI